MLIVKTLEAWTGPKEVDGIQVGGTSKAHQVPAMQAKTNPEHLRILEERLRSYRLEDWLARGPRPASALGSSRPPERSAHVGRTAFLFPGQGSQKVGMGADLLEARPEVFDRYLSAAQEASGLPMRRLCLEGPIEELTATESAQPALFSVSLAVLELAREQGITPDFVAGHSLGEYTAAVACGAIPVDVGMRLVAKRGRLMADIQSERPGAMAAIIGLDAERVRELCEQSSEAGSVTPANLNTPVQIVCSGEEAAVLRLLDLAQEAGADKAIRLQVGAAFHSELMEPVQSAMADEMAGIEWSDPEVPLCGNASGSLRTTADEVHEALIAQIASPVLWADCVRTLVDNGCDRFLELGPGRTLGGLVRQVDPEVETFSADSPKKLSKFVERAQA